MKNRILLFGLLFVLLSADALALQKAFLYVTLGYGRGWWGWACVTEKGMSGVHGYPKDFCGARDCPFEAAVVLGENNCINKDIADISLFTEDVVNKGATIPATYGSVTRINVQEDLKLVLADGTVVSDEVCVGDSFKLQAGSARGEYFDDGGNGDTPAIEWVDDVEALTKKILDYHERMSLTCKDVNQKDVPDGFVDSLTGIAVYKQSASQVTGRLVCSLKDAQFSFSGLSRAGGNFQAISAGTANLTASYPVLCMYYQYGTPGGCVGNIGTSSNSSSGTGFAMLRLPMVLQTQPLPPGGGKLTMYANEHNGNVVEMVIDVPPGGEEFPLYNCYAHNIIFNSMEDFFKIGELKIEKTLKVANPAKGGASLEVVGADQIRYGETTNIRVLVKNTGDTDLTVKKLYASCDYKFLSCDKDPIPVGETAECLISVAPKSGQKPALMLDYEFRSCGKTRSGTVPKVLMDARTITPKASVQAYKIGVHESCENSYYGCVPADREGNFLAGYECYNQNDKYYSAGKERFDLMYDLPDMSSKTILGAYLVLSAGRVNRPQTLSLFSVSNDWEPVTCRAGGDICTMPYCGECKGLFELSGEWVSSAVVNAPGVVSFDVSDRVKSAYAGGEKSLSFQVRGQEDLWESMGKGSCGGTNAWSEQDVEVQGPQGAQPYLEIIYR